MSLETKSMVWEILSPAQSYFCILKQENSLHAIRLWLFNVRNHKDPTISSCSCRSSPGVERPDLLSLVALLTRRCLQSVDLWPTSHGSTLFSEWPTKDLEMGFWISDPRGEQVGVKGKVSGPARSWSSHRNESSFSRNLAKLEDAIHLIREKQYNRLRYYYKADKMGYEYLSLL